jgi:hypothetical protein
MPCAVEICIRHPLTVEIYVGTAFATETGVSQKHDQGVLIQDGQRRHDDENDKPPNQPWQPGMTWLHSGWNAGRGARTLRDDGRRDTNFDQAHQQNAGVKRVRRDRIDSPFKGRARIDNDRGCQQPQTREAHQFPRKTTEPLTGKFRIGISRNAHPKKIEKPEDGSS